MNNLTGKGNNLEELIVEHQPRLKAFIRKRVSSKEDAEDIDRRRKIHEGSDPSGEKSMEN